MVKINEHSSGHEKRYFYFIHEELKGPKMKLYYTTKPSKLSKHDDACNFCFIQTNLQSSTRSSKERKVKRFRGVSVRTLKKSCAFLFSLKKENIKISTFQWNRLMTNGLMCLKFFRPTPRKWKFPRPASRPTKPRSSIVFADDYLINSWDI